MKVMSRYLLLIYIGISWGSLYSQTSGNPGDSGDGFLSRVADIPSDLLAKPGHDPIKNQVSPFFSFEPYLPYERLIFQDVTLPSTSVNIAKYARNPMGNERQPTTEIPGLMSTQSYAPFDSNFLLRYRTENVGYYMDGVPLARLPKSSGDLFYFPAFDDVQRIDFYNNASTMLGAGGYGSINYLTRNPDEDTPFRFRTNHVIGSDELYATNNSVEGTIDKFGYLLTYANRQWDGPRHNSDYFLINSSLKTQYYANENLLLTFGAFATDMERGNPGGLTTSQYNSDRDSTSRPRDRTWNSKGTGYMKLNARLSDESGAEIMGYGGIEEQTDRNQTGTSATNNTIALRNADTIGFRAKSFKFWDMWEERQTFNIGIDFDYYQDRLDNYTASRLSLDDSLGTSQYRRTTLGGGIYLQNEFKKGKFKVTPGARLDFYGVSGFETYNTSLTRVDRRPFKDHTQVDVIPQVSLEAAYEFLHKTDLFVSVMSDHNNITPANFSATGNTGVDPHLQPDTSWKYETGVRSQLRPWLDCSGGLFFVDRDNVRATIDVNGQSRVENARRVQVHGLEGGFRLVLTHAWQDLIEQKKSYEQSRWGDLALSGNISIMDSEVVSGDSFGLQLPYSPDFVVKGGVYYNYEDWLKCSMTGMWVEEYFPAQSNSAATGIARNVPTFMVWDLNFEYWAIKNRVRLMWGIHNLFDEDYYSDISVGGGAGGGIDPAPQRNYYLGVGLVF